MELPTFATCAEAANFLKTQPLGTACILTGGPTATDNVRVQLKRKGVGCSVVRLDNGYRRIVYQRQTSEIQNGYRTFIRELSRSDDPTRLVEDGDPNTWGNSSEGIMVGDTIFVRGNRKTLERDIAGRGWTASLIKTDDGWNVTRKS